MRATTVWQALMLPPWRLFLTRWPWAALLYAVSGVLLTVVLVPALTFSLVALPLWGMFTAAVERRRLRLLGAEAPASGHVRVPPGERRNWLTIRLTEPATWRETMAMLGGIVFGATYLCALFAQSVTLIVLVILPLQARTGQVDVNVFAELRMRLGPEDWWTPLLFLPVFLAIAAYLNLALTAAQGGFLRWLLAPRSAEIDARVAQLTRSRAAIVAAHESERRRIERDLHDGVQQELVGIAVRLGILELELASGDATAVRSALQHAQEQTERALETLRQTVRGIHPAVLTDHGVGAALDELAGRTAIPLRVQGAGIPRLSADAEAAAYFFVAEAITNAAKHTTATQVSVRLDAVTGGWDITVSDDGRGGADPQRGMGLHGIIERAEALGASVRISSPPGGPTELSLYLPGVLALSSEER